jgi:hypothetical protein
MVWIAIKVVSCPPCWEAVEVKALPTLPIRAFRAQSPPVWSQNCAICAAMRP